MTIDCDVVVIGAGLSGLVAADALTRVGLDVAVIEAADRVGGRTLSHAGDHGDSIDLGASFVCDEQVEICALIDRLGLHRTPSPEQGRHISHIGDRDRFWRGGVPLLTPRQVIDVARIVHRFDTLAADPAVQCPPRTPAAARLDELSVGRWLTRYQASATAKELVRTAIRLIFASELQEISLLHFLFCLRSAGGFRSYIRTRGREQQRISGGAQRICELLAANLPRAPRLGHRIDRIEQHDDHIVAQGPACAVRARRVVLAVPPVAVARIAFNPRLPMLTQMLYERVRPGSVVKLNLTYPHAFWRASGLSGKYSALGGPLSIAMDVSAPNDAPAQLMAAAVANSARSLRDRTPAEIEATVIGELARVFGPAARTPLRVHWHDWHDDIAAGGYAGVFAPGVWSTFGQGYRKPWRRVHFAGTETAQRFYGAMEGAVSAGQRVAAEVRGRQRSYDADHEPAYVLPGLWHPDIL